MILAAGIFGPLFLAAQNDDNATSTDAIVNDSDSATSTNDGASATSTKETSPGNTPANQTPAAIVPTESPLTVEEPKNEAAIVPKLDSIVMAVWAMRGNGLDDSADPLAQIQPSGILNVDSKFQICGVVRPGGNADTGFGAYGELSYPHDAAFSPNDPAKRRGCGQAVSPLCQMKALAPAAGLELFCQNLKKENTNLPVFASLGGGGAESYDYGAICADLEKQTAMVYCCDQSLAYDDLSGVYQAAVIAQDGKGSFSNLLVSNVDYLPVTAVDVDFSSINYGSVAANVLQEASYYANNDMRNLGAAYVRNVGNTRLKVSIEQNDMGLGKTDGRYNIWYYARYATINNEWTSYPPNDPAILPGVVDLSTNQPIEFAVTVTRYPDTLKKDYSGSLTVTATATEHLKCEDEP